MPETLTETQLDRPIFIVGTVCSGITLLAKCLGEHPSIAWGSDNGRELSDTWHRDGKLKLSVPGVDCTDCPPADASQATLERCAQVRTSFAQILEQSKSPGKSRFLNKNPHLWNKLGFLRKAFPDACVIITGRDVRTTVLSTQLLWMSLENSQGVCHYLPRNPECCWSCVPATDACHYDPKRTFPGGNVAVLADYWMRTYETIGKEIAAFETAILVKHHDFVSDPSGVLAKVHDQIGVSPSIRALETQIDPQRNSRWQTLLTGREQDQLDGWIERHKSRIQALKWADVSVGSHASVGSTAA